MVVLSLPAKYIILVHIEVCEFRNAIQTNVLLDKTHSCITVHQMLHQFRDLEYICIVPSASNRCMGNDRQSSKHHLYAERSQ